MGRWIWGRKWSVSIASRQRVCPPAPGTALVAHVSRTGYMGWGDGVVSQPFARSTLLKVLTAGVYVRRFFGLLHARIRQRMLDVCVESGRVVSQMIFGSSRSCKAESLAGWAQHAYALFSSTHEHRTTAIYSHLQLGFPAVLWCFVVPLLSFRCLSAPVLVLVYGVLCCVVLCSVVLMAGVREEADQDVEDHERRAAHVDHRLFLQVQVR